MTTQQKSMKEAVIAATKETGILPCIKVHEKVDFLAYARAMYDGGARIVEITMTSPGVFDAIEAITSELNGRLFVAAGTVLDPVTAREVILHGGNLIVSPTVNPQVIAMANRYSVPVYSGAFTPTECLTAHEAGADMVKVFPAQLGGAKYMTNLRMVFPGIDLIPSGGISLENAQDFIKCGACAVSGARMFMNNEKIAHEGLSWLTQQVAAFIDIVRIAKEYEFVTP